MKSWNDIFFYCFRRSAHFHGHECVGDFLSARAHCLWQVERICWVLRILFDKTFDSSHVRETMKRLDFIYNFALSVRALNVMGLICFFSIFALKLFWLDFSIQFQNRNSRIFN